MVGFQELFHFIIFIFSVASKIMYCGLIISSTIGKFIVKYAFACMTFLYTVFETAFNVVKILYEDYCIFMWDVINKGIFIANIIRSLVELFINTLYNWWLTAKNICLWMYESLILTVDMLYVFTMKAVYYVSLLPDVLRNSITLIGSGIWLAVKLIPLGFVYTISMCIFFVGRSFEELLCMGRSAVKCTLNLLLNVVQFVNEIPVEALAGLMLGVCILYGGMKYRTNIIQSFQYLHNRVAYIFHCAWTRLELLVLQIFANQNNEIVEDQNPVEPQENESNGDNEQVNYIEGQDNITLSLRSRLVSRVEPGRSHTSRQPVYEVEKENMLCVVCQDRDKRVIILPCRHLCLCIQCSSVIHQEHGTCPICRQIVRRTMKIYV